METKICTQCNVEQEVTSFSWHYKDRQIRHRNCKTCVKQRSRNWYNANKQHHVTSVRMASKKRRDNIRQMITNLQLTCSTEGCTENHVAALEFHHVDPSTKEHNISDMVGMGCNIDLIKEEMAKCVVLCCNCHRKEHWRLRNQTT